MKDDESILMSIYTLEDECAWLPTGAANNTHVQESSVKCECGTHKVYGADCPDSYHSQWCPAYSDKLY